MIKGSINLPAQSLYPSLPTLLNLCQSAGIKLVIWYCGERPRLHSQRKLYLPRLPIGSSKGRGTRAASWFRDLLQDRGVSNIRSVILADGIAGWAKAGDECTQMMEEFDAEVWQKSK